MTSTAPAAAPITDVTNGTYELELEFTLTGNEKAGPFGVLLSNSLGEMYRVGYDPEKKEFFSDRTKSGNAAFSDKFADKITRAPRNVDSETVLMHLIFDQASAELFADDGSTVITDIFFPGEVFNQIALFSEMEGAVKLSSGKGYALERIWPSGTSNK